MLKSTLPTMVPAIAPNGGSQTTLLSTHYYYGDLDVVVFGHTNEFTAALMAGLRPAIEGDKAPTPEGAMRKLLIATAELLNTYIPKVGTHQRNIHGGGVFDEDMISPEIIEARKA